MSWVTPGGDGADIERPTHRVKLTYDLYVGKYPVTFDEYRQVLHRTGATKPENEGWERGRRR